MSQPVINVRVRRPRLGVAGWTGEVIGGLILLFAKAAVVSWALSHVSALPSLGYIESAWTVLAVSALFHHADYLNWSTPEEK